MVDPTQAYEYAGYAEGFSGYDRMEEDAMFYQPGEEASQYYETEEVAHGKDDEVEDVEAEDVEADDDEVMCMRLRLSPSLGNVIMLRWHLSCLL